MSSFLISVIIPVYNIEKYLNRCIESIVAQTYTNIEIIIVDDGSTDDCPNICDYLKKKDSRIKVIHKINGGLSSARNAGMDIAKGKYIIFIDGDDTIDTEMFYEMINMSINNNVDVVMCDYIRVNSEGILEKHTEDISSGLYLKEDIEKNIFDKLIMRECIDYGPLLSVWICMYKLDFLKKYNIMFDSEIKWSEDNMFSAIVGYNLSSFYYMKGKYFYNYFRNDNSITTSYKKDSWKVYELMNKKIKNSFDTNKDYDFSRQIQLHMIYYALNCIGNINKFEPNFEEKYKRVKAIIDSEHLREIIKGFKINQENYKLRIIIFLIKYRMTLITTLIFNLK